MTEYCQARNTMPGRFLCIVELNDHAFLKMFRAMYPSLRYKINCQTAHAYFFYLLSHFYACNLCCNSNN